MSSRPMRIRFGNILAAFSLLPLLCVSSVWGQEKKADTEERETPLPTIKVVKIVNSKGETVEWTTRKVAFLLGKNLGYQAALGARAVPKEKFADSFLMTKRFAEALDVELGEVPDVKSFGDIWDMVNFVSGEGSLQERVENSQNAECGELVRLGSTILLASSLYSNNFDEATGDHQKQINEFLIQRLLVSGFGSNFKQKADVIAAVKPMYDLINDEQSGKELGTHVQHALDSFQTLLHKELVEQEIIEAAEKIRAETTTAESPLDKEARQIVESLLSAGDDPAQLRQLTLQLKPTASACNKLFDTEVADRAKKVYSALFDDPQMTLGRSQHQTDVKLRNVTTNDIISGSDAAKEFSGGYRRIATHLKPGFTFYEFSFVKPGETRGMRYDGLVKIDEAWFLFPKVWRVMEDQPFGLDIK